MSKFHTYLRLLPAAQDQHGFIASDTCDSLLFSALVGCVPGTNVDLDAAFDGVLWQRRPCEHPCYPEHSKSTISRDMILGILWYAWANNRLDLSESIIKYALSHFGIMGKGVISRTLMSPSLLATAAQVSYALGGPSRHWLRWIPIVGGLATGFEAHLHVLQLLLRDRASENAPKHTSMLAKYAYTHPRNALFQIAAGDVAAGHRILCDTTLFPEDRLPSTAERHEPWLWQRDNGQDWAPSNPIRVHSGGDLLFAWALAMELI